MTELSSQMASNLAAGCDATPVILPGNDTFEDRLPDLMCLPSPVGILFNGTHSHYGGSLQGVVTGANNACRFA